MSEEVNKFGVPHHNYILFLKDGTCIYFDVGDEELWGNVQPMLPTDFSGEYPEYFNEIPGWGNDADGHTEIVAVKDEDIDDSDSYLSIREWAKYVWSFAYKYSS